MTQFERIKEMGIKELAEFLLDYHFGYHCHCVYADGNCLNSDAMGCEDGTIAWLNSEVEE